METAQPVCLIIVPVGSQGSGVQWFMVWWGQDLSLKHPELSMGIKNKRNKIESVTKILITVW